jgi:hypothetical protein
MAGDVMVCPRGHALTKIVRDGVQRSGGRQRQRWRCTLPDGSFHRFLGVVSRTRSVDETCTECENHLAPHEGPAAPADFEYLLREISGALVEVGRGSTYSDAAQRVRMRANVGKTGQLHDVTSGQTVAEWLADFVPVIAARHQQTEWPAVLVLDSVNFRWTDKLTGKNHMLYSILAAYGYDENGKHGRLWKVEASPTGDATAWAEFLASLPGTPVSIVSDQDNAIQSGIQRQWGADAYLQMVHLCEHHMGVNARAAMGRDTLTPEDEIWQMFGPALTSRAAWDAFEQAIAENPKAGNTRRWAAKLSTKLQAQTARRTEIPPVYSNGALEAAMEKIRMIVAPRAYAYRNRTRTNLMLELVRLSQLRADNASDYTMDIRTHLTAHNGRPPRTYRAIYDGNTKTGEPGLSSLWNVSAQLAMREARRKLDAVKAARAELTAFSSATYSAEREISG